MTTSLHIVCPHCDAVNRLSPERLGDAPNCGQCARPLFSGAPVDVLGARFDKHIARSDIPVLVDFWAPWCGPCQMMTPAYKQATAQLEPQMRVLKVNTEEAQDLAARFNIRSIPTLAVFKGGREVARQPGAMGAADIVRWASSQA